MSSANLPPDPPSGRAHFSLLAEVSRAHYLEHKSKVQIAQEQGLSRFQVATLLQEARDRGVVRISITVPTDSRDREVADALGIPQLVSVEAADSLYGPEPLARALAAVVTEHAREGTTIGIAWSRTIQAMAPYLPDFPHNVLVQLAGAVAPADSTDAVPRLLAGLTAKAALPLWAPLVVESGAAALSRTPEIARTLECARSLDLAVVAIGAWGPRQSTVWSRVPEKARLEALGRGAVAEIYGRLLTADGAPVHGAIDEMIVAATLDDIHSARHTVGVSHGEGRAHAVLAAVRAGLLDTVVCDAPLRDALAELVTSPRREGHP